MKYQVEVTRVETSVLTLTVVAASEDEAARRAIHLAVNFGSSTDLPRDDGGFPIDWTNAELIDDQFDVETDPELLPQNTVG